jgi:type II secretory pathway component PulF
MYPMIVLLVMLGIFLLILIEAVPRIASVFSRLRMQLPLPTRILIAMSNLLLTYPLEIAGVTILLIAGVIWMFRQHRAFVLSLLYPLPVISTLMLNIDLTQFSRNMALLLSSGVPITDALELSEASVLRLDLARAIHTAHAKVMAGEDLSAALKKKKHLFPGVMVKIIEAGEQSGTLDKSMQDIAEYFDYRVTNSLKTLTTVLEPVMLVIVGAVVGTMMLSIIGPIYNLIGQVSPH